MKLFTKIALGIAGFFGSVAVICAVIAFAFGFTLTDFQTMVRDGKFNIGPEDGIKIHLFDEDDIDMDMDIDLHHGNQNYSDDTEYQKEIPHACSKIYVEYGGGTLDIRYADVSAVQVVHKNVEKFALTTSDVEEEIHISGALDVSDPSDATLTILVPEGTKLEKLDLEIGAGSAKITELCVENLNVEVGVGEVDIKIAGAETDYNYNVECGMGQVTIGDNSFGGLGNEQRITNPNANCHMDIECGIGEVNMHFTCVDEACDIDSHHHKSNETCETESYHYKDNCP